MRAFRVDKMTLAALEATLRLYRDPDTCAREVPILAMLRTPLLELRNRADRLARRFLEIAAIDKAEVAQDAAFLGGGSIPTQSIESIVVRVRLKQMSEADFATRLRLGDPPVIPRVQEGWVLFDLRTILVPQEDGLVRAVANAGGQ